MTQKLNYGEIWFADLNPRNGIEPGKTRSVLIIQSQSLLDIKHPSTLIIPLTTNLINDAEPLRIRVKAHANLNKESDLLIDQIRAIDNKRFTQGPILRCDAAFMKIVQQALLDVIDYRNEEAISGMMFLNESISRDYKAE
jgi:mRNA interferase MazF